MSFLSTGGSSFISPFITARNFRQGLPHGHRPRYPGGVNLGGENIVGIHPVQIIRSTPSSLAQLSSWCMYRLTTYSYTWCMYMLTTYSYTWCMYMLTTYSYTCFSLDITVVTWCRFIEKLTAYNVWSTYNYLLNVTINIDYTTSC